MEFHILGAATRKTRAPNENIHRFTASVITIISSTTVAMGTVLGLPLAVGLWPLALSLALSVFALLTSLVVKSRMFF